MSKNKAVLSKLAIWPEQDSAVGYYRILQPGRFLKREGWADEVRTVPFSGWGQAAYRQYSDKTFMEICDGAEVLHTTLLWRQADILKCLNLRKHFGLKWVVDIDDNLMASPADNAATDNAEVLRKNRETCLRLADGLTVSVPSLKELYSPFNANVFVMENGLDFSLLDPLKPRKRKRLRIGWRGALGHKQDLELIRPVIQALKKDYEFDFVCFGYDPGFADEFVPWEPFFKEKLEGRKRVETANYYEKLAWLGIDIAVVPLVDSAYNRCKSAIGWAEWSALGVPVCYSPTENHKGLPGIACDSPYDWYKALSGILERPKERKTVGNIQKDYVHAHLNMVTIVPQLAHWFAKLPRRTDLEP